MSNNMGGGKGGGGAQVYDKFPISTVMFGGRNATNEEKAIKRETVKRFINEAKVGNVYKTGAGFGSGSGDFEIVHFNRSPNKMGIKSGNRTVALTSTNVSKFIQNGARRIKKK